MSPRFALYFIFLIAAASAGCRRRTAEAPGRAVTPTGCRGRQIAVVVNNWNESVEIFSRLGSDPTRIYIATVAAGRREQIRLPDGARYVFAQPAGAMDRQGTMPASSRDLVDIRYLCE